MCFSWVIASLIVEGEIFFDCYLIMNFIADYSTYHVNMTYKKLENKFISGASGALYVHYFVFSNTQISPRRRLKRLVWKERHYLPCRWVSTCIYYYQIPCIFYPIGSQSSYVKLLCENHSFIYAFIFYQTSQTTK